MIAKIFKNGQLVTRLHDLIRRKTTGTPEQLAQRLCVCDRTVERYIAELKDVGFPIGYCTTRGSYYYYEDCHYSPPELTILAENDIEMLKRGKKLLL